MLLIPWNASQGWGTPEIKPCMSPRLNAYRFCIDLFSLRNQDGPLSLDPSSTVLHYAQCVFEGLKAYRNKNGKVTVFRPELNMKRMNLSAQRLALPVSSVHEVWRHELLTLTVQKMFNGTALLDLIKELVRLDRHWIPQEDSCSLYIRPVMSAFLGILILSHVLIGFPHLLLFSWYTNYRWHFTSRFCSPVCYLQPSWAILPGRIQTSGFARHE